jgi:uncharacterized phiE125 gp8 family phage protein
MTLLQITPPDVEPVTLAQAKKQLEIDDLILDDDEFIEDMLIPSATLDIEATVHRPMITRTMELQLDGFPACARVELPLPPLQSVVSVKYLDAAGVEQTWAASNYVVDAPSGPWPLPGCVRLAYAATWPTARSEPNAVRIRFLCGYGDDPSFVPGGLKTGVLLALAELHQHRDPRLRGKSVDTIRLDYEPVDHATTPGIFRVVAPYWLPVIA